MYRSRRQISKYSFMCSQFALCESKQHIVFRWKRQRKRRSKLLKIVALQLQAHYFSSISVVNNLFEIYRVFLNWKRLEMTRTTTWIAALRNARVNNAYEVFEFFLPRHHSRHHNSVVYFTRVLIARCVRIFLFFPDFQRAAARYEYTLPRQERMF